MITQLGGNYYLLSYQWKKQSLEQSITGCRSSLEVGELMQTEKLFSWRHLLLPLQGILLYLNPHTQDENPEVFLSFVLLLVTWLHHFWSQINVAPLYFPGEPGPQHLLSFFLPLQRRVWEINLKKKQNKLIQEKKKSHIGRKVIFHSDKCVWLTCSCGREKWSMGLLESLRRK